MAGVPVGGGEGVGVPVALPTLEVSVAPAVAELPAIASAEGVLVAVAVEAVLSAVVAVSSVGVPSATGVEAVLPSICPVLVSSGAAGVASIITVLDVSPAFWALFD